MATGNHVPEVTEVVQPEQFVLVLSREEAGTLNDLFAAIGGTSKDTRRKHVESMSTALRALPVDYTEIEDPNGDIAGQIYFLREDQRGTWKERRARYGGDFLIQPHTEPRRNRVEELLDPDPWGNHHDRDLPPF